jgi:Holliday junction resolvasome RuvABC endonuclease subunit
MSGPASGVWLLDKTFRRKHPGARFRALEAELRRTGPNIIAYEEVRRHMGTTAAHVYGGWLAVIQSLEVDRGTRFIPIGVTEAKKHATGKGNADKAAVIAAMRERGHAVTDDNEADALAVWYCARERMLNV